MQRAGLVRVQDKDQVKDGSGTAAEEAVGVEEGFGGWSRSVHAIRSGKEFVVEFVKVEMFGMVREVLIVVVIVEQVLHGEGRARKGMTAGRGR